MNTLVVKPTEDEFKGNVNAESLYEVLGVSKTATAKEIRRAYRKAAMKWHPDRHGGSDEVKEIFQCIQKAYDTLSNPLSREFYDNTGMRKPEADQVTHNAHEMVHQIFLQIIDQVTMPQVNIEIDYFDVVKEARKAITDSLANIHNERSKMQGQISKLQALQRRMKKKENHEQSPLKIIFDEKLQKLKARYSMGEVDIEIHKQALEYANEYICTPDERPQTQPQWNTVTINSTGTGGDLWGSLFKPGG
jgi:DnaJ-class molecular chaperone